MNVELFLAALLLRCIIAAIPLLLGTLGEIITERSGILNLGVEGMMAAGALAAFATAYHTGNLALALLAGIGTSCALALIHGVAGIVFRASQTVSGLAVTMLGLGISGLLGKPYIGMKHGIDIPAFMNVPAPDRNFFTTILSGLDVFLIISAVCVAAVWFFFSRTLPGIRLKTCGENPRAAEAQGISVERWRLIATVTGGVFSGLAGAFLSLSYAGSWNDAITGGRGWIAVALTIFALWNPLRAIWGAFLFGGLFVLQFTLQPLGIPSNVLGMLPYLATLVIMVIDGLRSDHRSLEAPAALGELFRRGER